MRTDHRPLRWVVYLVSVQGKPTGMGAVCEQGEWDVMEAANPGQHCLVRAGIASEAEAEALARQTSGYVVPGVKPSPYKLAPKPAKRAKV
jgi:hypothetical protein